MRIRFHYNVEKFRLRDSRRMRSIIYRIIKDSGLKVGLCDIVFTTDGEMLKINKEFLGRDYFTDVITFNNNVGREVNGEIYVSIDTVRRNANDLEVSLKSETRRVIFHGILHLCGYKDNTKQERALMGDMEDLYLALAEAE